MRVFVAGATGAMGRYLVPRLIAAGHEVTGLARSQQTADWLRGAGVQVAMADALDRDGLITAVREAKPEAVIHQLTGLAGATDYRRFDKSFALTNRLRMIGTDNLLEAARAAGARRFIAQSYGGWNYTRTGGPVKTEQDPLDPHPPANQTKTLEAIRYLEQAIGSADDVEGLSLRYGNFYGPGSGLSRDGDIAAAVRKRRFPIVGDGGGIWSFIHLDDAAAATVAALEHGAPGIYNICDDEPVPVRTWLPAFAQAIGAKPPRHVPVWLGRLLAGDVVVSMMTQVRGASNNKARLELAWLPHYGTYRDGFSLGLG